MTTANHVVRPPRTERRRLSVNITPVERAGRIVLGAAAIIAAIVLLIGAGSAVVVILEVLLAAAGLDLVVTGALGHCPLYQKLGFVPSSMRSQP
jgi:predicted phage tail protein